MDISQVITAIAMGVWILIGILAIFAVIDGIVNLNNQELDRRLEMAGRGKAAKK